jgi:parallel beta-helix repeat protein
MSKINQTITFIMILLYVLAANSIIQPVRASGPIHIRADGTVDPSGAPIQRTEDLYTLTANITSDADGIIVEKSGITIDGNGETVQGGPSGRALYLYGINNVTIKNTRTEGFRYGIYAESTSRNVIYKNNMTGSAYDGIGLYNSSDNIVLANNMNENGWSGIGLYFSSGNNISANYITNNYFSVNFYRSQNNLIFHNNFISNINQTSSDTSPNVWDDDYPSGGNYWADNPNRTDNYRGPNQDQPGSDGIGDTSYTIDADNVDYYPLTKPYGGLHDIGLTKGPTTKTAISQSKDLNLTIIILNYGFTTETFNATAYFDTTQLVQTQITLTSRNSASLIFILNTTDLTRGNHTITAYADPMLDETATTDNTLHSWVTITYLGDVNGDGRVDMKDVAYIAKRFGSDPSSPLWDPNADLNDDDRIDMKDVATVARNFGKTSP